MQLPTGVRFASKYRVLAMLLVAACAILMLFAVLAVRASSGGQRNQVAVNSAAVQDASSRLGANGCILRMEATSTDLVPCAHLAPSGIRNLLTRHQARQVVLLNEAQLTAENIELMNRLPAVDVILFGPTIADASLLELSKLAHLGWLRVESTVASQPGLSALQAARPDIRISHFNAAQTGSPFTAAPAATRSATRPQPSSAQ